MRIAGLSDAFGTAVTRDGGRWSISGIFPGTYPKVVASAPGYLADDSDVRSVDTRTSGPVDFELTRDWAAGSGGASITDFNGPDYTPQCGPDGAIDLSQGTGWGSTTGNDAGDPTNVFVDKHITIALPRAVDITSFQVDPTATCGDPGSSSTGALTIETSTVGPDGPWTVAAQPTFDATDRNRYNPVHPTAGDTAVKAVKVTITGNQVPDFVHACAATPEAFGGCTFTDLTEFAVLGAPAP